MYKDLFIVFWSFLVTNNSDNDERFLFRNDVEIQMYAIEQKFNFGSIKSILFPLLEEASKSFQLKFFIQNQRTKYNMEYKM